MHSARDEIIKTKANDCIKTAFIRNVSAVADAKIDVGDEELMFPEKFVLKWEGLYIATKLKVRISKSIWMIGWFTHLPTVSNNIGGPSAELSLISLNYRPIIQAKIPKKIRIHTVEKANALVKLAKRILTQKLAYAIPNKDTVYIICYADALPATIDDLSSQFGFIIIHWVCLDWCYILE